MLPEPTPRYSAANFRYLFWSTIKQYKATEERCRHFVDEYQRELGVINTGEHGYLENTIESAVKIRIFESGYSNGPFVKLDFIVVDDVDERRKGLGTRVLADLGARADRWRVPIEVLPDRQPDWLPTFYHKSGFTYGALSQPTDAHAGWFATLFARMRSALGPYRQAAFNMRREPKF